MTMANDSTIYNPSSQATLALLSHVNAALYQEPAITAAMSARRDIYYHRMNCRLFVCTYTFTQFDDLW
jgi:hypothetical protein